MINDGIEEVFVIISAPDEIIGPPLGYLCRYEVNPLDLKGTVIASDPFEAIRNAVFQVRLKLVYRHSNLKLTQKGGKIVPIDYEQPA